LWLASACGFSLRIGGFSTLNLDVSVFGLIFFTFRFSLSICNIHTFSAQLPEAWLQGAAPDPPLLKTMTGSLASSSLCKPTIRGIAAKNNLTT
jgi:hypothetical protein